MTTGEIKGLKFARDHYHYYFGGGARVHTPHYAAGRISLYLQPCCM